MSVKTTKELQPNEQLIHLLTSYVEVTTAEEHGGLSTKKIEHSDFLKVLTSSMKVTILNSHEMNAYELGSNVIKFRASEDGFFYYFLVKKGKYPYNNQGKVSRIHYPNILFKIGIDSNYQLRETSIVVIKDKDIKVKNAFGIESLSINPKAKLFHYPLGNVNTTGTVCWGGNVFPVLDSYSSIFELVSMFFESPSNSDFAGELFNNSNSRSQLLKKLMNEEFDEKLLTPTKLIFDKY